MAGTLEEEIVVVLGKEREHKAGYFDEIKDFARHRARACACRRVESIPTPSDARSGENDPGDVSAINEPAGATGAGRSLARSWWECHRSPEPRRRWDLIEHLSTWRRSVKARLHRDSGVLAGARTVDLGSGTCGRGLVRAESLAGDFWQGMGNVLRAAQTSDITSVPTRT